MVHPVTARHAAVHDADRRGRAARHARADRAAAAHVAARVEAQALLQCCRDAARGRRAAADVARQGDGAGRQEEPSLLSADAALISAAERCRAVVHHAHRDGAVGRGETTDERGEAGLLDLAAQHPDPVRRARDSCQQRDIAAILRGKQRRRAATSWRRTAPVPHGEDAAVLLAGLVGVERAVSGVIGLEVLVVADLVVRHALREHLQRAEV